MDAETARESGRFILGETKASLIRLPARSFAPSMALTLRAAPPCKSAVLPICLPQAGEGIVRATLHALQDLKTSLTKSLLPLAGEGAGRRVRGKPRKRSPT
jgi:hypothetical protein